MEAEYLQAYRGGMLKMRADWKSIAVLCLAVSACQAETKVIRNFTLIDGTGRPPLPKAAMVVVDGHIDWVGPAADLKAPAGAAVTDWSGKFVMPGMINLHGHLGNTIDLVQDPKNFTRANVEKQLKIYARYGVTTMLTHGQRAAADSRDARRAAPHEYAAGDQDLHRARVDSQARAAIRPPRLV